MNSLERKEIRYKRRRAKRLQKVKERSEQYSDPLKVFSTESIVNGFNRTGKASSWKVSTKRFKAFLFTNARYESKRLLNGSWKSKGVQEFDIIERGHARHIQNVHISEKAVQAAMSNECLIPILTPTLIYDNGASVKGKGTDFALKRLEKHLRSFIRKHGRNGWIYFYDFSDYFASIRQKRLLTMLSSKALRDEIIAVYVKFLVEANNAPIDKSYGLGLGSQVFQVSAVFYPNPVDHWAKDQYGCKYYAHYMDDGYAIFETKEEAKAFAYEFCKRCKELELVPNMKKCRIVKLTRPFTFLKMRYHITDTNKIVKRINPDAAPKERRKLKKLYSLIVNGSKTFIEVRNEFHSWLCGLNKANCFTVTVDMIRYFNKLFREIGEYELTKYPLKKQRKKHHMLKQAIRMAA